MQFDNRYEKQMISIDMSLFSIIDNKLHILLMKRIKEPYLSMWSLVGGGVYNDETLEDAIKRELKEKINIDNITPILSSVFSNPKRDVRFRNISISYYALTHKTPINNDIYEVKWFPIDNVPDLAFDHNEILKTAINQLKAKVYDIDFIKPYLPKYFTLTSLQLIYESILETSLDKRNFRRKLNSLNCLKSTGRKNESDTHRKSEIYTFN